MKEEILSLRASGLSYRKIASELNTTVFQVEKVANPNRRSQLTNASAKYRKKNPLVFKLSNFTWLGNRRDGSGFWKRFSHKEFLEKIGENPVCFFTKTPIDLSKPETYSIDHLIPVAQGGSCNLDNAVLVRRDVNELKMNRTPEQFLAACKEVLEAQGFTVSKS